MALAGGCHQPLSFSPPPHPVAEFPQIIDLISTQSRRYLATPDDMDFAIIDGEPVEKLIKGRVPLFAGCLTITGRFRAIFRTQKIGITDQQ
jgi:hypothetical protein